MRIQALLEHGRSIIEANDLHKGSYAATASGVTANIDDPNACKFCTLGAFYRARNIEKELPEWDFTTTAGAYDLLEKSLPNGFLTIPGYNDAENTTKDDVLALFDRAIELAKKGSQ